MGKLINAGNKSNGTSFFDITIKATANELMKIAENNKCSYYDNYGAVKDKSQFDFDFETEEGVVFTVYDWKEYKNYSLDDTLYWHIGGHSSAATRAGLKELRKHLKHIRYGLKEKI